MARQGILEVPYVEHRTRSRRKYQRATRQREKPIARMSARNFPGTHFLIDVERKTMKAHLRMSLARRAMHFPQNGKGLFEDATHEPIGS